MNILTDELPTALRVSNTEYQIDSDFRTCLRIILAFEDNDLTPQEKQIILLSMLFVRVPTDIEQAMKAAHIFLNGGAINENEHEGPRLYSFGKDANFIFAAFRQTHGIDLQTTDLHWWKFLALFMDLGSETTFCNLVSLRKRIKSGKASKDEKEAAREMGDMLDVPEIDARSLEEKEIEKDFFRKVAEAQAQRKNNGG